MRRTEKSTMRFSGSDLRIGCVIMASGLSRRFGSNKLLAEYQGKTFIERTLELTKDIFDERIVLTRSPEIMGICESHGVEAILHTLTGRNEAVALGISKMKDMDACLFCPCDQPMLKKESVLKMIECFRTYGTGIIRLCYGKRDGAPVMFSKEYFDELSDLPEKKGGGYLACIYPDDVIRLTVSDEKELLDIDTEDDYRKLIAEYE